MTTDTCTAACDHCSVFSHKSRRDRLTREQMIKAIGQAAAIGNLQTVIFAGGEPTLLKEDLYEAIAFTFSLGINTRIVTNASWATTPEKARSKVAELRMAGLAEINISLDRYHAPYIPHQNVKNAWDAAHDVGFKAVVVATNETNLEGFGLPEIFEIIGEEVPVVALTDNDAVDRLNVDRDGTLYCVSSGPLQKIGRANEKIEDEAFNWFDLEQMELGCHFFANNPALSPRNTLLSCCGIEANNNEFLDFGELNDDKGVSERLHEVSNDTFRTLFHGLGPVGIARVLKKIDPEPGLLEKYTSVCHVCEHITTDEKIKAKLRQHENVLVRACLQPSEHM